MPFEKIEIVETIADSSGVRPEDLDYAVFEYVDLDAIEALVEHDGGPWTLTFEVPDSSIIITSDGEIAVAEERSAAVPNVSPTE